jgi:hypothetical protein
MTSAHHAALAKVNPRKLPVGILQRGADRRYDLGPTATDLGLGELEAVRLYDADAVLRDGNGIQDRLAAHLDESLDLSPIPPGSGSRSRPLRGAPKPPREASSSPRSILMELRPSGALRPATSFSMWQGIR